VAHSVTHFYYNIHRALYSAAPALLKLPAFVSANALLGTTAAMVYSQVAVSKVSN
jgi:hypothetical protein